MPKTDSKMNEICQNLMEISQTGYQGFDLTDLSSFESFATPFKDCIDLECDLSLLRPLKLEKQHGRIDSDSTRFNLSQFNFVS